MTKVQMKTKTKVRIGTRSSKMALAQTHFVAEQIRRTHKEVIVEIVPFKPSGDVDQTSKLDRHGGKGGAFVTEIRQAIRTGELHCAMHSLKDMPGDEESPGLVIGATLRREKVEDVLVVKHGIELGDLQNTHSPVCKIGTNSVRRAALLRRLFPSGDVIHFRGAVDTRIRKLDNGEPQQLPNGAETEPADAIVVARAGLERLGMADRITHIFNVEEFPSAVGQGVIAVESAHDDWETRQILSSINHGPTHSCAEAEREMLWILNGHCNAPIAGLATIERQSMTLRGVVFSMDGSHVIEHAVSGDPDRPRELGRNVGLALLQKGAVDLIQNSKPEIA